MAQAPHAVGDPFLSFPALSCLPICIVESNDPALDILDKLGRVLDYNARLGNPLVNKPGRFRRGLFMAAPSPLWNRPSWPIWV